MPQRERGEPGAKGPLDWGPSLSESKAAIRLTISLFLNIWWALYRSSFSQWVCVEQTTRVESQGPDPEKATSLLFIPALTSVIPDPTQVFSDSSLTPFHVLFLLLCQMTRRSLLLWHAGVVKQMEGISSPGMVATGQPVISGTS